jgi:hypothetical protein
MGDFLDPFSITDIEVTDPTTGLPLSGISITGADGITYPVNISSVPEPNNIWFVLASIISCIGLQARRRIQAMFGKVPLASVDLEI